MKPKYLELGQWCMLEGRKGGSHHQSPPSPAEECPLEAGEIMRSIAEPEQLQGWGGHHHHHQPNSWPRCPLEGIPEGWQSQENQEVPAWNSCPL